MRGQELSSTILNKDMRARGNRPSATVDLSNGKGWEEYCPNGMGYSGEFAARNTVFGETEAVAEELQTHGSLLLKGLPGAGKSHMIEDLVEAAYYSSMPYLFIELHKNAGKLDFTETTVSKLEQLQESGGLLVIDNVDYVGYRGRSKKRSGKKARDYAEQVTPSLAETVTSNNVLALGTAHTDTWRKNYWTFEDPVINKAADELAGSFSQCMAVTGELTETGALNILHERNNLPDDLDTDAVIGWLAARRLLTFRYVNNCGFIEQDTSSSFWESIAEVDMTTQSKLGKAAHELFQSAVSYEQYDQLDH